MGTYELIIYFQLILLSLITVKVYKINQFAFEIRCLKESVDEVTRKVKHLTDSTADVKKGLIDIDMELKTFLNNIDAKYADIIQSASKKNIDKWDNLRRAFKGSNED